MKKRCKSITWDREFNIYAVLTEKRDKSALSLIKSCSSSDDSLPFAERLSRISDELGGSINDPLILGGYIPGSISVELSMPKLPSHELTNALSYEITRHLPFDPRDNLLFYRQINRLDKTAAQTHLRILSIKRKSWESLLGNLTASGIKADTVTHPFMAVDPILSGNSVQLETIEPDFCLIPSLDGKFRTIENSSNLEPEDHIMDLLVGSKIASEFRPAILLAAYGLTDNFSCDQPTLCTLPSIMIPQRHRLLKFATAALIIAALGLSLGGVYRSWSSNISRLGRINREKARAARLLEKAKTLTGSQREQAKIIETMNKAVKGGPNVLKLTRELAVRLPRDMWLTSLKVNEKSVSLKINASGSTSSISTILNRIDGLMVKNLRKTSRRGGESVLYITLEESVRKMKSRKGKKWSRN